ncbi:MAG: L,D-transpeptidase, partial [Chloroflexia bacterium]|nr:L,D-transpeptidase [Chloroflexia bacterium]
MRRRSGVAARKAGLARAFLFLVVLVGSLTWVAAPANAYPVDPNWAPPPTVYIPATGQTIDRLFLDLWRSGGGSWSYGNPITPELTEPDGRVVQYFEYARFEYWPNGDANGNYVTLGSVGSELGAPILPRRFERSRSAPAFMATTEARAWMPLSPEDAERRAVAEPSYRYVEQTQHGVWGGFRQYWEATGEIAYLGNPVSEEYTAGGVSYQVFERGKLQWSEGVDVSLVPIGAELVQRYQLPTAPGQQGGIPTYDEALFVPPLAVPDPAAPPAAPPGGRSLVISLSQQALWAFNGNEVVRTTYVSTGTEKFRTPTGLYFVN